MDHISNLNSNPRQAEPLNTLTEFKEFAETELNKYNKLLLMKGNQDYKNRQLLQMTGNLIENLLTCLNVEDAKGIIQKRFRDVFEVKVFFDKDPNFSTNSVLPHDSDTIQKLSTPREVLKIEEADRIRHESYLAQSIIM